VDHIDVSPTNLEILRLAKELAYSDYNNRKADLHNRWVAESDYMWRTHKLRVAYPPIPSFPSEEDIMKIASRLLEFLSIPRTDFENQAAIKEVTELIYQTTIDLDEEKQIVEPVVSNSTELTTKENSKEDVVEVTKNNTVLDKIKKIWK